jgi:hypothetical protein
MPKRGRLTAWRDGKLWIEACQRGDEAKLAELKEQAVADVVSRTK